MVDMPTGIITVWIINELNKEKPTKKRMNLKNLKNPFFNGNKSTMPKNMRKYMKNMKLKKAVGNFIFPLRCFSRY